MITTLKKSYDNCSEEVIMMTALKKSYDTLDYLIER